MEDPRIRKFAKFLIRSAVGLEKGEKILIELHGSENRYTCLACGKKYDMSCVIQTTGVPRCPACGAHVRGFFGEYCKYCGEKLDWDKPPRS